MGVFFCAVSVEKILWPASGSSWIITDSLKRRAAEDQH